MRNRREKNSNKMIGIDPNISTMTLNVNHLT